MSRSLNKVMLIGNVGNDPEIRATSSGARVAKVSLATNRSWTDRNSGQKNEKTEWHRLTFFGRLVDVVEQWVKKGDRLYVEGRIEYSQTEGEGGTKYWTDIVIQEMVMLGSTGGGGGGGGDFSGAAAGGGYGGSDFGGGQGGGGGAPNMNEPDDDLPF
ncbi:MAG: single-stranded DNA-binding protein [Gemmatimonadetes bacterium]|nr:single-stranded DNA-binding protein [Gemmatimonadota bacterium]NNF13471.1 single-stranded DNA-binding protein [Gemmatimonadota bacterium]NNL31394.1 single-stranded DNA-binding protein [Gemmatimonadota bacterium]